MYCLICNDTVTAMLVGKRLVGGEGEVFHVVSFCLRWHTEVNSFIHVIQQQRQ